MNRTIGALCFKPLQNGAVYRRGSHPKQYGFAALRRLTRPCVPARAKGAALANHGLDMYNTLMRQV